jgi:hypothetical protein
MKARLVVLLIAAACAAAQLAHAARSAPVAPVDRAVSVEVAQLDGWWDWGRTED